MACLLVPANAQAQPIQIQAGLSILPPAGNWIATTIDLDLGMEDSPWGLACLYQVGWHPVASLFNNVGPSIQTTNPLVANILGRYRFTVFNQDSVTAFAGMSYYPESYLTTQPGFNQHGLFYSPVIGATYTVRNGRTWINVSPHYAFSQTSGALSAPWYLKSGVPLIELGVSVTPAIDLSLRASFTPVRATYRF
ncbi:hypothetical protein D3C87_1270350 [compost metagenome]